MKKLIAFVAAVVAMGSFAEDWVYPGTKGDGATCEVTVPGGWTLSCSATKSGGKLTVNKIVGFPDEPAVLDLSGTFVDSKGAEFILGEVWGGFSDSTLAGREMVAGLVLPATGPTAIGGFYGCVNLASINCFPDTLTTIGAGNDYLKRSGNYGAFQNCTALAALPAFPPSLTTINGCAFSGCTNLTTIEGDFLPDTVTKVHYYAFFQVPIERDLFLRNVKKIERQAFYKTGITSVTFGSGVKQFGCHESNGNGGPFCGCANLTNVTFEAGCENLAFVNEQAGFEGRQVGLFKNCSKLTGTFDTSVFTNFITGAHFSGTGIEKLIIDRPPVLPNNFFSGMGSLSIVVFKGAPPKTIQKTVFSGVASGQVVKTLIGEEFKDDWAPYADIGAVDQSLSFWSPEYAGSNYRNYPLRIDVPEKKYDELGKWVYDPAKGTITDGMWTFEATANDKVLTVGACIDSPDEVSELDFTGTVSDPNKVAYWIAGLDTKFGVKSGQYGDDYGRSVATERGLKVGSLKLPDDRTFTTIGARAFACCRNLTKVSPFLPDGITTVGMAAFYSTPVAGDLRMMGVAEVVHALFKSCTNLSSVAFGPKLSSIGSRGDYGPFQDCKALTNVTFDARMANASIGNSPGGDTFKGCVKLCGTIDISGFKSLGNNANQTTAVFSGTQYDTVILATNLSSMSAGFFNGMASLNRVIFKGKPPKTSLTDGNKANFKIFGALTQTIVSEVSKAYYPDWEPYLTEGRVRKNFWTPEFVNSSVGSSARPVLISDLVGLVLIVK